MVDSLIETVKEVLGEEKSEVGSIDPERLENHQEELRERMTEGAGGCLHVSLAADALRKNREAEPGTDD